MQTMLTAIPLVGTPGMWEIVLIVAAVLVFFGATRLPKLGKGLGQSIRAFKVGLKGEEPKPPPAQVAPPPVEKTEPAPAAATQTDEVEPNEADQPDESDQKETDQPEATSQETPQEPKDIN